MREKKYLIKNYKQMFLVITVFILVLLVGGVSIAFFNYTRTGGANAIRVGRIAFNTTQNGTINLTNIFPMSSEEFENSTIDPSNNVTINITGDTTYPNGIEYLITLEDVNVSVGTKNVPISLIITPSGTGLGVSDDDYFTNRGGNTTIYKQMFTDVRDGNQIFVGDIIPGETGINGSINIKAFVDADRIAISDTYDGTESSNMGTTRDWVNKKTVFTTSEWNSLSGNSTNLSFKIKVEANEGIWVEEQQTINTMSGFPDVITNEKGNITKVVFERMNDNVMQTKYDAATIKADVTYNNEGRVLAYLEENTIEPTGTNSILNTKPSFLINKEETNNMKQIDNEITYTLHVVSNGKTYLTTGENLFNGFSDTNQIQFKNINTERVTSMYSMFSGCSSLTSINLSGMGSDILTTITSMFSGCNNLGDINMSDFNFGATTSLYGLFQNLTNLTMVDLTNANTSSITDMVYVFYYCKKLADITGINTLDTSNVTSMVNMFYECDALTGLDLSNLDISSVQSMYSMFYGCDNLESVIMHGNGNGSLGVIASMFYNCSKLSNLDLSGLGGNNLNGYSSMFTGCTSLKNINMSNFNFGNIFNSGYSGTYSSSLFYPLKQVLETINLSHSNISGSTSLNNLQYLFDSMTNLKSVDLSYANVTKVTRMYRMFNDCSNLINVNLTGLDTQEITTINYMFSGCSSLEKIDMNNFGGNKLQTAEYVFNSCTNLKEVNMKNFNFGLFNNVPVLFSNSNLEKIDLSNAKFNTSMSQLFYGLNKLKIVNLSGIDTTNITNMQGMFKDCTSLQIIYVSNTWNTSNVTDSTDMFNNCTSLIGGNGTVFDSTKTDKTMAVIDTPTTPGYFTLKQA